MPCYHLRFYADFVEVGSESEPQHLNARKIELLAEKPACIIFAKAVRGDERPTFIFDAFTPTVQPA